jgi:hypothetical protein
MTSREVFPEAHLSPATDCRCHGGEGLQTGIRLRQPSAARENAFIEEHGELVVAHLHGMIDS